MDVAVGRAAGGPRSLKQPPSLPSRDSLLQKARVRQAWKDGQADSDGLYALMKERVISELWRNAALKQSPHAGCVPRMIWSIICSLFCF